LVKNFGTSLAKKIAKTVADQDHILKKKTKVFDKSETEKVEHTDLPKILNANASSPKLLFDWSQVVSEGYYDIMGVDDVVKIIGKRDELKNMTTNFKLSPLTTKILQSFAKGKDANVLREKVACALYAGYGAQLLERYRRGPIRTTDYEDTDSESAVPNEFVRKFCLQFGEQMGRDRFNVTDSARYKAVNFIILAYSAAEDFSSSIEAIAESLCMSRESLIKQAKAIGMKADNDALTFKMPWKPSRGGGFARR